MASIFQIGISRNTKRALKDGFCKSSHICSYIATDYFTSIGDTGLRGSAGEPGHQGNIIVMCAAVT